MATTSYFSADGQTKFIQRFDPSASGSKYTYLKVSANYQLSSGETFITDSDYEKYSNPLTWDKVVEQSKQAYDQSLAEIGKQSQQWLGTVPNQVSGYVMNLLGVKQTTTVNGSLVQTKSNTWIFYALVVFAVLLFVVILRRK
jgi:hypothetical protein